MAMWRDSRHAEYLAKTLCAESGLTYHSQITNPELSGILFANKKQVVLAHVADGLKNSTPFLFGTVKAGPRATKGARLIVMRLPKPVPNMVLLSVGNGVLRKTGIIAFDETQRLGLDGVFDKTFTLYCPVRYKTDALYIFTPDLMCRLQDTLTGCDVEFVDNRVIIYAPENAFPESSSIRVIPELLRYLSEKLNRQTANYGDAQGHTVSETDPFQQSQLLALGGADSGFRIAREGWRINRRLTIIQKIGVALAGLLVAACAIYWVGAIWYAMSQGQG